jgi:hypothetical protein
MRTPYGAGRQKEVCEALRDSALALGFLGGRGLITATTVLTIVLVVMLLPIRSTSHSMGRHDWRRLRQSLSRSTCALRDFEAMGLRRAPGGVRKHWEGFRL